MEKGKNVQDLVDCFDEIPEMMSKIKSSHQNQSRFQILEPNHSYSVSRALRGNRTMDTNNPNNLNQVNRMVMQAKKVLAHLNQIPRNKKGSEGVESSAGVAADRLAKLKDSGVDLNKFYQQYDVNRNGKVSYKDFSDILLSMSAGIGREDAMQLAAKLDKHKAGCIEYRNILSSLQQLQTSKPLTPLVVSTSTASPSAPTPAPSPADFRYIPADLPETTFTLQALSPTLLEKRQQDVFNAGSGRRMLKTAPYYVDPQPEKRKRAHSEPPKGRTLAQQVRSEPSAKTNQFVEKSLRSALLKDRPAVPAPTSPLQKERAEVISPLKRMLHASEDKKVAITALHNKVAENAIVQQLQGNVTVLRHLLKQQDRSRSGYINSDEFRTALNKAGVLLERHHLETLFDKNSVTVGTAASQDLGLSKGKAINIESFVDQIQARTTAPAFSYVTGDAKVIQHSKDAEKVRVMKKVLHSVNKLSNPQKLFNDVTGKRSNDISSDQLREALQYAGACLSDSEFKVLVSEMDANHDGRISLREFDHYMHGSVNTFEQEQSEKQRAQLMTAPHYSRSYQSSGLLSNQGVAEFHRLDQTRQSRRDKKQWEKLKEHLQVNHDKVLRAFDGQGAGTDSIQELSVPVLCRKLATEGVVLGRDDAILLNEQVTAQAENKVISVEKFCDFMGIPLQVTDRNTYATIDRTELTREEGVFASSHGSITANTKYSSSVFLQTDEDVRRRDFGLRKRRGPQSLGEHMDTSKFWEFQQSVENPMLFPTSLSSNRPSFANSIDLKLLRQGVISLRDRHPSATKLSRKSLAQLNLSSERDTMMSDQSYLSARDRESVSTTNMASGKRSHSAPPASRSLGSYAQQDSQPAQLQIQTAASGSKPSDRAALSDKVSKWSTATLTDYFSSKESGKTTPRQRSDSRESTVSPSSYGSASTGSLGTTDRLNRGSKFFNNADRGRTAMRKQFDQSLRTTAPFATDY